MSVGCGAKLDGDWNGAIDIVSVAADVQTKGPVELHVSDNSFTIVGAPFTQCTVKLEKGPGGATLHFEAGKCSVQGEKSAKAVTLPEGNGWIAVKADVLTAGYTPPVTRAGAIDVAFQLSATRAKK
jgi:hypothetical protein